MMRKCIMVEIGRSKKPNLGKKQIGKNRGIYKFFGNIGELNFLGNRWSMQ